MELLLFSSESMNQETRGWKKYQISLTSRRIHTVKKQKSPKSPSKRKLGECMTYSVVSKWWTWSKQENRMISNHAAVRLVFKTLFTFQEFFSSKCLMFVCPKEITIIKNLGGLSIVRELHVWGIHAFLFFAWMCGVLDGVSKTGEKRTEAKERCQLYIPVLALKSLDISTCIWISCLF